MLKTMLSDIRRDYTLGEIECSGLKDDPVKQFSDWIEEAIASDEPEPTAMTLATVDPTQGPDARMVLLKGLDQGLLFYSNYKSAKGRQIESNNRVSIVFHWPILQRQVRIKGTVARVSRIESESYFSSRPVESQISAIVSRQSERVAGRDTIEGAIDALNVSSAPLSCPEHWGGYRITPNYFEFWQGRKSRLHDRICYEKRAADWLRYRLSP